MNWWVYLNEKCPTYKLGKWSKKVTIAMHVHVLYMYIHVHMSMNSKVIQIKFTIIYLRIIDSVYNIIKIKGLYR